MNDDRIAVLEQRISSLEREVAWLRAQLSGQPGPADADADPEVLDAIRQNQKIEAIRRYRQLTGLGLKESKDAVEALEARLASRDPEADSRPLPR